MASFLLNLCKHNFHFRKVIFIATATCHLPSFGVKESTMESELLERVLSSSSIGEKTGKLIEAYLSLEEKEKVFVSDFSIHCTPSCGECCCHYVPYLTESEALVAALIIIRDGREDEIMTLLSNGDRKSPVCPLYNRDKSNHCSLYDGRSLVCRLFGDSVSLDKNGHPIYRECKWKKEKRMISSEELEKKKDEIPVMSNYGEVLEGEGEDIYSALPKAIGKIKLILSYSECDVS